MRDDDGAAGEGAREGITEGSTGGIAEEIGQGPEEGAEDVELTVVTMIFDASDDDAAHDELAAVLARYVVLARREDGCRNVDLCASVTRPGRYLVVQKWSRPEAQRAHFDSALMVEMARQSAGLLGGPPDIDLWDAASAHDLR